MRKSLTRRERLSGKRDIQTLFSRGKRYEENGITLFVRSNGLPRNRILVTTRRGFRTAVKRNRQKRILKEIYRNSKENLVCGFDCAFVLKKEEASWSSLRRAFIDICKKARLQAHEYGKM
ncbi:MAG TPA: ribonuclease P protein component [Spirochaetia bacterium]|nr:ribonuclease P protein component [Spirochaetia bacterium]